MPSFAPDTGNYALGPFHNQSILEVAVPHCLRNEKFGLCVGGQRRERSAQTISEQGTNCPPPPPPKKKNLAVVMLFINRVTLACDYEQSISVCYRDQQMYNMHVCINNILYTGGSPYPWNQYPRFTVAQKNLEN
jgi:hypothetical protein